MVRRSFCRLKCSSTTSTSAATRSCGRRTSASNCSLFSGSRPNRHPPHQPPSLSSRSPHPSRRLYLPMATSHLHPPKRKHRRLPHRLQNRTLRNRRLRPTRTRTQGAPRSQRSRRLAALWNRRLRSPLEGRGENCTCCYMR